MNIFAQSPVTRAVLENEIPGDNVVRFYRLAIPVTNSAFEEDFYNDYNKVVEFWQECEDFVNKVFAPLGFCFDVIVDQRLQVAPMYDDYDVFSLDTYLLNQVIGSDEYDVAMWVAHRDDGSDNTGQSAACGAYSHSTKGTGYAKPDSWVVAHEIGHLFGATHTIEGEGSLMDNEGEFFSYQSIKEIRQACLQQNSAYYSDKERKTLVGNNAGGNYVYGIKVENGAPAFDASKMKNSYRIPQGSCLAIEACATDKENNRLAYMSVGDVAVIDFAETLALASLAPQESNVLDYRPRYAVDIFYPEYYLPVMGTEITILEPGIYGISILVNDLPKNIGYEAMLANPFYSNYAVWDATVEVVGGTPFEASVSPAKESYTAGENVTVEWGVNNSYFTSDSRLRVKMSTNYGRSFDYVLAESVPARDGSCKVALPNVNVGNVDVDFITATRSMPGGIIRIEEIGGAAYALTALSPEFGGSFNVTGGVDVETGVAEVKTLGEKAVYDLQGRKIDNPTKGLYIINGKKYLNYGK